MSPAQSGHYLNAVIEQRTGKRVRKGKVSDLLGIAQRSGIRVTHTGPASTPTVGPVIEEPTP